jgi:uncharacterized protein YprB with RNaseH-like and TPR domain
MTQRDDQVLREILEALTRLRLSHDRYRERQWHAPAKSGEDRPRPPGDDGGAPLAESELQRLVAGDHGDGPAEGADFRDLPWLDEAGTEPRLEALVGAEPVRRDGDGVNPASAGSYLRREVAVEERLPHLRGLGAALREAMPEAGSLAELALDVDVLAEARAEELVFLDLETTGLHRGNIMLLGFMTLGPGERPLTVTQLFPRDYDEEGPLLGEFLERLRRHPVLITFNGKSFDAPFLESRLRFHGYFEPLRFAHVDLLHLARRLWRNRLPDFRLQTLERRLFGRRRLADLPGSEVPRVWEDFVRHGELRHLPGIWEHNLRDLTTLAELLIRGIAEVERLREVG